MAEAFEPFHVPQQSRRDKLRVVLENHPNSQEEEEADVYGVDLLPSMIPPHMLGNSYRRNPYVRQQGRNSNYGGGFMNCNTVSSSSSSSSSPSSSRCLPYSLDPQFPLPLNYIRTQDINNNDNHFVYTARESGREVVPTTSNTTCRPQALSLSLSSHNKQLNLLRSLGGGNAGPSAYNDVRSAVPLGPFTGYATILKGSRFLIPAQQLLEDFCYFRGTYVDRNHVMDTSMEIFDGNEIIDDLAACSDGGETRKKKTSLIAMLDEVYRRYKLYYQQMQTIVASFESVPGLANAAPYTSFALNAMSKHFRCLKNAITDQLQCSSKSLGERSNRKDGRLRSGIADFWVHDQRTPHNPVTHEPYPIWKPQRGLPDGAVACLKAWLFEHFLHPYPSDTDKQMLAKQTGLSRSQVSNWFINARVRLWRPMVEEMFETNQSQTMFEREKQNEPSSSENPSLFNKQPETKFSHKREDQTSKRSRSERHQTPEKTNEPMNFTYNISSSSHHLGNEPGSSGANSGVSLTLGLQQNNGIGLSEALPMNIARRFGLDASNEGYIGSFEARSHLFSKDFGGRLLHDFVG